MYVHYKLSLLLPWQELSRNYPNLLNHDRPAYVVMLNWTILIVIIIVKQR